MKRKLPRLIDICVTRKDRRSERCIVAADGRVIVYGEPLPIDLSAIVWSERRGMASDQIITYDGAVPRSTD